MVQWFNWANNLNNKLQSDEHSIVVVLPHPSLDDLIGMIQFLLPIITTYWLALIVLNRGNLIGILINEYKSLEI